MKRLNSIHYIWQHKNWPHFTWDAHKLLVPLSQARVAEGKLIQEAISLGFEPAKNSNAELLIEETITTAAIEGEILNRETVRSSIAKRLGLPTAGMVAPDRNIEGLIDVLQDATQNFEKPLTLQKIKSWHHALFPTGYSGLYKIKVGVWRGKRPMQVISGPLGSEKIHFEAPPSTKLQQEMADFISWWNTNSKEIDGLLRAAIAHFYFVTIHPFEDGNGRIARALTDLALAQDEKTSQRFYSLSSQIMAERKQYYDVLESCQKGTLDITPWLEWFLGCFLRATRHSQKLTARILLKGKFWNQLSQTSLNERQRKVINKLLDAGPQGFEGGLTTRKYKSMTHTSRATAFREISELVKKEILTASEKQGRSTSYEINWKKLSS